MPATILYENRDMIDTNESISAKNRINYQPYVNHIVGTATNKSAGNLREAQYTELSFDALQQFPADRLAKLLKPAATEIATADLVSSEKRYHRAVEAVKVVVSNLKDVNTSSAFASILNSLDRQWDHDAFTGMRGNIGLSDNPNMMTLPAMAMTTPEELIAAIARGVQVMKTNLHITDTDLPNVAHGYTAGVSELLGQFNAQTGDVVRDLVNKAFPDLDAMEIPASISGETDYIELFYRPMLELQHGAIPSQYASESGDFGLSQKTLFVYETATIWLDEKFAGIRIPKA